MKTIRFDLHKTLSSIVQSLLVVGKGSSDAGHPSEVDPAQGHGTQLPTGARPFAQLP